MTLLVIDKGIDTGNILDQVTVRVSEEDTGYSANFKICAYSLKCSNGTFRNLSRTCITCVFISRRIAQD